MNYKETIKTEIYGEPDEQERVKKIGMRTFGEVFNELKENLDKAGLLPDDYFELSSFVKENSPMPDFNEAICYANFGGSEGIYVDVLLQCKNAVGQNNLMSFAVGKTLGEATADYYKMSLIAGECSMLLNGNGSKIQDNTKSVLILNDKEADELKSGLRLQAVINEGYNHSNETVNKLIGDLERSSEKETEFENEDEEE